MMSKTELVQCVISVLHRHVHRLAEWDYCYMQMKKSLTTLALLVMISVNKVPVWFMTNVPSKVLSLGQFYKISQNVGVIVPK